MPGIRTTILKTDSKKILYWILGMGILVGLYEIGEVLASYIPFPVPGPVVGLILIFTLLVLGWIPLKWVEEAAHFLLIFLGLFYVPYGVGIIDADSSVLNSGGYVIVLTLIVTLVVMWMSGHLFSFLGQKTKKKNG